MKRQLRNKLSKLVAVACISLLAGCNIYDSMEECDLYLYFTYDYNMDNADYFTDQVDQLHVYLFDEADNFVKLYTVTDSAALHQSHYRMPLPYSTRNCKVVVWAGKIENSYLLPQLNTGDPISKLTLQLAKGNSSASYVRGTRGSTRTEDTGIDDLWHAGPVKLNFLENYNRTQTISLVRCTNNVNVQLTGTGLDPAQYEIKMVSDNGKYFYTREIIPTAAVTYLPYEVNGNLSSFRTMRFVKGYPMTLTVVDKATRKPLTFGGKESLNLVDWFQRNRPNLMTEQEYLDREYEWEVILNADGYVALSITINGWTTWFQNSDL